MQRPATALLLACLLIGPAAARDATLGATTIALPPPAGYCEMDAAQPSDARLVGAIESLLRTSGNRLLAVSADCKQLADWRVGKRQLLDNMAQYQTLAAWESGPLPGAPDAVSADICNQMRVQGEQLVTDMTPDIRTRTEEILKTVKVNEMKFLGVLTEEPRACYSAMLQRFRTEIGTDKTQLAVFATTIVKDKLVYSYLFAPYVDGDTLSAVLAQLRENVRSLRAANPG